MIQNVIFFNDCGAHIMYSGSVQTPDQAILPICSKNEDNTVLFLFNEPLKNSLIPIKII